MPVTISGANSVCCNQTVLLTANGGGADASYVWRDGGGNVVGTERTFQAGAGTYTVTVTDACGSRTSAPFTVSAQAATPIPTMGEWALLALVAMLAAAALARM